ncbi:related to fungal specific transcription factor [Phialocephala subalpina]|uniref:Related to fungal specific transcription factor n=1 Tax=Phialocephala subalpina TaxID=576137 RepID=A0A1L7X8R2_9HELO|nr:related to fungal specific transcription factor [Phialocephala subalpina]
MSYQLASHACASCRQRKRKCDKLLPQCSLCSKKNLTCTYSTGNTPPSLTPSSDVFFPNGAAAPETSKFPAVFFLDANLFQKAQFEIPRAEIPTPKYVLDLVGDIGEWRVIATKFFETVNHFMPIVSRSRLYGKLLNPLAPRRNDVVLLILCLRLICMLPAGTPMSRRPEYLAAKRFHAELEISGAFSPQVLQSGVLIALYEFGHAIYPAAYLTVGGLARYGISSGIDGAGPSQMTPPSDWIEAEERKRAWWAVLILDRSVNLGNPTRTLATQEPSPSSVLPMCDDFWDQGILSSDEPFTLSSPASLQIGRFARFAQATFLLGRVYKHVSDSTLSKDFLEEEATQLRRTLQALATIVDIEGQGRKLQFCTQAALCYSGMLLLQESYSCLCKVPSPDIHFWDPTISIAESIARESARIATSFLAKNDVGPATEKVSPFILHLFYHSQVIFLEKAKRTGIEAAAESVGVLSKVLVVMDERWKAAGKCSR